MLLSLAVLASVTAMVAAMWSQADGWARQNSAHHDAMHLQRTIAFMRNQWADRRSTVQLTDDAPDADSSNNPAHRTEDGPASAAPVPTRSPGVSASPETLTFVTATPVIDPDAPIVIAEYRIENEYDEALGRAVGSRLVYREHRVGDLSGKHTRTSPPAEHVLFSDCRNLRFERFGLPVPDDRKNERRVREPEAHPRSAWRRFDEPYQDHIPAVRLLGELNGEPFSCVFVIEASR